MIARALRCLAAASLLIAWGFPASARDLCPERPGQTTPPCTIEPGRLILETSAVDWTLQQSPDTRVDTVTIGQSVLRIGIANHAEVAIGWTPFATSRSRDRATGFTDRQSGIGDIALVVKRSFGNAKSPPIAIKIYATLPVGRAPSGLGDWSAGMTVPVSVPLTGKVQFAVTPEIDAAVNGSGNGRHVAFGGAAGLGFKLSNTISLSTDLRVLRDNDPGGSATKATAGMSVAVQSGDNLQFDAGGNAGINQSSPDLEIYLGISRRF